LNEERPYGKGVEVKNNQLKKEQMEQYREKLLELRHRLTGDLSRLQDSSSNRQAWEEVGGRSSDEADKADADYSRSFNFNMVSNKQEMLWEIDGALDRIEEGSYGECESCGVRIPLKRLNAKPFARYCIKCAEKLEEEGLR